MPAGPEAPSRPDDAEAPHAHWSAYRRAARTSAALVSLIGGLALLGWIFEIERAHAGPSPLRPLTALGLLVTGVALFLATWDRRRRGAILARRALALGAGLLGALAIVQYALGVELGIDDLIFAESLGRLRGSYPGRPAIFSGIALVLAGTALWLLPAVRRGRAAAAQIAALGILVGAMLALTGYAYGGEDLYAFRPPTPMSPPAAVAFLALAIGILAVQPEAGIVAAITGDDVGGFIARRLLPVSILIPFLLGWARLLGLRAGLFGALVAVTLSTVATMVVLAAIVWWTAAVLRRLDLERRRAEEAAREGELRLRTVLEALPIGVWFTDAAGRIIYGNPAARRIWAGARYVPIERYGEYKAWWPATGKRIEAHGWAVARALERRQASIGEEIEIEAFDGTHKLIRNSALPLLGPDGGLRGAVVVNEDITERKAAERERERARAEAELRAREEEALRRAAEAVAAPYTVEDVTDQIAKSALEATGAYVTLVARIDAARGEVGVAGGAGARALPVGTSVAYAGSLTERAIQKGGPEIVPRLADDPRIPGALVDVCPECAALAVPMAGVGEAIGSLILVGAPSRAAFTPEDVDRAETFARLASLAFSKARLLEETEQGRRELQRLLESQARLVRGFTHDVKNPLGAADGTLALLEEGIFGPLTDRQRENLARTRRSVATAIRLIDALVEFARAQAGQVIIKPATVDVRGVADHIAEEYRASAEAKGLAFELERPPTLPTITSDPDRVRQILGNLISNAVKYTDTGGVRIRVAEREGGRAPGPGRWIAVDVSDTGPGIPETKREAVFGEFVRLEPGRGRGAGLGLAISRSIARALGGDVTLESEVGKGSTFTLWLPLERPATRPRAVRRPEVA